MLNTSMLNTSRKTNLTPRVVQSKIFKEINKKTKVKISLAINILKNKIVFYISDH